MHNSKYLRRGLFSQWDLLQLSNGGREIPGVGGGGTAQWVSGCTGDPVKAASVGLIPGRSSQGG